MKVTLISYLTVYFFDLLQIDYCFAISIGLFNFDTLFLELKIENNEAKLSCCFAKEDTERRRFFQKSSYQ